MIQIRETTYRRTDGYLICGTDPHGRRIRIFTEHRAVAEHIGRKARRGEDTTVQDFAPRPKRLDEPT